MEDLFYLAILAVVGLLIVTATAAPWIAVAKILAPRVGRRRNRARIAKAVACLFFVELGPGLYGRWRLARFEAAEARDVGSGRGPTIRSIQIDQDSSEAEDHRHFELMGSEVPHRLSKDAPLCGPLCLELLYEENLSAVVVEARPCPPDASGRPSPRYVRFRRERRQPCPDEPSLSVTYNPAVAAWLATGECLIGEPVDAPGAEAAVYAARQTLRRWEDDFGCVHGLALRSEDTSGTARIEIAEGVGDRRRIAVIRNSVAAFVPSLPFVVWAADCSGESQWLAFQPVTQPAIDVKAMLRERYGFTLAGSIPEPPGGTDLRQRALAILQNPTVGGSMTGADAQTVRLEIGRTLRLDRLRPADIDLLRLAIRDDAFDGSVPGLGGRFPARTEFQRALTGDVLARILRAEPWGLTDATFTRSLAESLADAPVEVLRAHGAEIRRVMESPPHLEYVAGLVDRIPEFDPEPRGLLITVLLENKTFSQGSASRQLCRLARPGDGEVRTTLLRIIAMESPGQRTLSDVVGLVRAGGRRDAEAMAKTEPTFAALLRQVEIRHREMPGPDDC